MQPDVRYCTTADGVRIAYTVTGTGPVFVSMIDAVVSHVSLEWSNDVNRPVLEEEARYFTLVRFDQRGSGLSERRPATCLDETLLDLEAVVSRLRLDEFTLHANATSVITAIAFAARHPHRVSRLAIVDGFARAEDFLSAPQVHALTAAVASDWELATEAVGAMTFGPGREESRTHGEYIRSCVGPEYFATIVDRASFDATTLLPALAMPVLVIRHLGVRWITDAMTQDLVSLIPDARLVTLNGTWVDDPVAVIHRMAVFVYEGEGLPIPQPETHAGTGVRTILFTDLVGHTEMMRRLGDARGREVLREHERLTREAIMKHGGTEIKTDGDSFMVSFGSVAAAVECAVGLQRAVAQRNETASEPLGIRMGLNAGEPVEDEGDLFGEAVIVAARVAAQAGEGEILVPDTVRHLLAGKGFAFVERGEFVPKGFDDAIKLYAVNWRRT